MNITDPIYADEDKAREHLESIQWPDGPFARSAATAIPSELRNSSSALIAFRGSELSRRLAQNSKVGILVVIESVVVAYPFLGGLHHRYARI